ncbi:hypothetical protein Tco_0676043 [Tanacetum coccineum]
MTSVHISSGLALQRQMMSVHISSGLALQRQMTSVHISSGLTLHRQMASADITSGPAPQRKESQMALVQFSPGPAPNLLTPGPISSGLVPNPAPAIPYAPPINKELEMLFQPMFDEYFNPLGIHQDPIPNVAQDPVIPTGPSVSIAIDLDAPSGSYTSSPLDHHSSSVHRGLAGEPYTEVNPFAVADPEPFVNVFAPDYNSEASSSGEMLLL